MKFIEFRSSNYTPGTAGFRGLCSLCVKDTSKKNGVARDAVMTRVEEVRRRQSGSGRQIVGTRYVALCGDHYGRAKE